MAKKNQYKDTPELPSDLHEFTGSGYTMTYTDGTEWVTTTSDVSIYGRGIYISTNERFLMRLWLLVSNPFRYLFTGKLRY